MGLAIFFLLCGFVLGIILSQALDRAEQSSPSRSPRSRPVRATPPLGPRSASSSNVRRVPRWEQDYAAAFLDDCRKYGQNEATRRRTGE